MKVHRQEIWLRKRNSSQRPPQSRRKRKYPTTSLLWANASSSSIRRSSSLARHSAPLPRRRHQCKACVESRTNCSPSCCRKRSYSHPKPPARTRSRSEYSASTLQRPDGIVGCCDGRSCCNSRDLIGCWRRRECGRVLLRRLHCSCRRIIIRTFLDREETPRGWSRSKDDIRKQKFNAFMYREFQRSSRNYQDIAGCRGKLT